MEIEPDTKDWTWVLQRPCGECGFDTSSFARDAMAGMIRDNGSAWELVLEAGDVRTRPAPAVWSPLEYGCHVRDVFRLYDYRLGLMLSQDDPMYPNWDQDETAVRDRYAEQDPARVQVEVVEAAQGLADRIDSVAGDTWQRPGRRSDGANFTVESIARYMLHDVVHHLHDVTGRSRT